MDENGKASKSEKIKMTENKSSSEVVIEIQGKDCLEDSISTPMSESSMRTSSTMSWESVDEDEEIYKKVRHRYELKHRKGKIKVVIEWVLFVCITGCLVASLSVEKLKHSRVWRLEIWKWCVLILVTLCGLLVTDLFIRFAFLFTERNRLLRTKMLYLVLALKGSVQVCIWLSLVVVTWVLLFSNEQRVIHVFKYVTWTLVSLLLATFLGLLKTLLLKMLASSFYAAAFFYRIQESIFHQYVLKTLSGPPLMEHARMVGEIVPKRQLSFRSSRKGKKGKRKQVIDMSKLHEMKKENVSAWTKMMLVDVISNSALSTFSNQLRGDSEVEITSEIEAIEAAEDIFQNVTSRVHPRISYCIDDEGLRKFLTAEEVNIVLPQMGIGVTQTREIHRAAWIGWVVKVYNARKALANMSNDKKSIVEELNKIVTGILIVIIIIIWLLLMEIATIKVLILLSSQLVVAAFMFGNTCKNMFEAIVFVFFMHPFGLGDCCVIDGVQMIVEEIHILTTVFMKLDNEMIYFPNSILATKPISNFNKSPDMGDSLEFSIDIRTPVDTIMALKDKIRNYFEANPKYWYYNHNVVVKEIENVDRMRMALFFKHTMNFQDSEEKNRRRSELILEIKKFFEELKINYNLLPGEAKLVKLEKTTKNDEGMKNISEIDDSQVLLNRFTTNNPLEEQRPAWG